MTDTTTNTKPAAKRYRDALLINDGACNPSGIARALVKAIDEAREEGAYIRDDAACRLIIHQLAYVVLGTDCYMAGVRGADWHADRATCAAQTEGGQS